MPYDDSRDPVDRLLTRCGFIELLLPPEVGRWWRATDDLPNSTHDVPPHVAVQLYHSRHVRMGAVVELQGGSRTFPDQLRWTSPG